ncbi:hypothetical protein [Roseibacillus persicicus]|uniref:Uncharacterized protein n=2 Tax=Roseibacillus persicicus TaxID=454148 RepID=A0A918TUF8_9BACT|nr:hypothetical protein GCM10007100_31500 [Roseibacillus persicicus]
MRFVSEAHSQPLPMVEKYSIKSRSHCCHVTGEAFVEDQPFIAAIFPDPEASGYLRLDYSMEAWEARDEETEPFSFWRSHYKPPVQEEKAQVTPHDPESLFAKLVEDDEEHTENARFILAAMLERKKIIRETDTQQLPTGLLRIYEHRKSGDVFIVKDPQIALADVESIQEEVQQLLDPEKYAENHPSEESAAEEGKTATDDSGEEAPAEEATTHEEESQEAPPETADEPEEYDEGDQTADLTNETEDSGEDSDDEEE